ncbi:MAG: pyridoxal phosphate-dependent aminotransferase [Bacillota bacterium]|nr:pyridoxal phosphate-dependent aminotransferase [Bacillota bacterium]
MISERLKPLMANNSAVRMMFEEGNRLRAEYGKDKVFDFSLGNPDAPVPEEISKAIKDIVDETPVMELHGYMSNAGYEDVRATIAEHLNKLHGTSFGKNNILMTVGAASALNIALKTVVNPGEEVVIFAPYFLEYNWYVNNADGVVVPCQTDENFLPDMKRLEECITEKTRAVLINTPHNPTGVVYSEEVIKGIAEVLEKKQKEYDRAIFLISDEPYRELAYDGIKVPYITKYYDNTFVVYSYSKSLSLPGDRIGYLVVPPDMEDSEFVFETVTAVNRISGAVNAPSIQQKLVARCIDSKVNLEYYDRNRKTLYNGLKECGFECVMPQGAFYLFLKSPVEDAGEFCNAAKKYNILMVNGASFKAPGYVRLAYCVSHETIENSLPAFKKLAEEYNLNTL